MSTASQTNANRVNVNESTGPRTAEGKARSSRNSTIHGLTGKSPILPGEDPSGLQDLTARYRADLHPEGQAEQDLVDRMAVATYRLRRIARIETGCLDLRLRFQPMPEGYNQDGSADPLAWAFLNDCQCGQVLDKLGRYESRIQREYSRCLADLQKLQAARQKKVVQTNSKSRLSVVHPTPSSDSDQPVQPIPAVPAPAPDPPYAEN